MLKCIMLAAHFVGVLLHALAPAMLLTHCVAVLEVTPLRAHILLLPCAHPSDGCLCLIICQHVQQIYPLRAPVLHLATGLPMCEASCMQVTNGSWSRAPTEPRRAKVLQAAGWSPSPVQQATRAQRGGMSPAPVTVSTAGSSAGQAKWRGFALRSDRRRIR